MEDVEHLIGSDSDYEENIGSMPADSDDDEELEGSYQDIKEEKKKDKQSKMLKAKTAGVNHGKTKQQANKDALLKNVLAVKGGMVK